jgi:hypothetical protein
MTTRWHRSLLAVTLLVACGGHGTAQDDVKPAEECAARDTNAPTGGVGAATRGFR